MDGGAWWAAVHEVAKSRTRLSDLAAPGYQPRSTVYHEGLLASTSLVDGPTDQPHLPRASSGPSCARCMEQTKSKTTRSSQSREKGRRSSPGKALQQTRWDNPLFLSIILFISWPCCAVAFRSLPWAGASHCGGFSCGERALGCVGFVVSARALSSYGSRTLEHRLNGCSARA